MVTTSASTSSAVVSSRVQNQFPKQQSTSIQNLRLTLCRKWELKKMIEKLENENTLLRKRIRENITQGPKQPAALLENIPVPKGGKYSDEFKDYCLSLYFLGPKLYRDNFATKLYLPNAKVLQNFVAQSQFPAGLSETTIEFIQKKFENFQTGDKECFLCMQQMIMKPYLFYGTTSDKIIGVRDIGNDEREFKTASRVLVTMIKGLYSTWEQPVGYYFENSPSSGENLKKIVMETISKLGEIKLKVRGVICNMKSNYNDMGKLLGVTEQSPYFLHGDKKVVFLYDTDDLLRITRNELMYHNFHTEENKTCWSHIENFYDKDEKHKSRVAPHWTKAHAYPTKIQENNLKYAVEIFNDEVAAAIKFIPSGWGTGTLIKNITGLHRVLNNLYEEKGKRNNQQSCIEQLQNYNDILDKLQVSHDYEDITEKAKTMVGWKTTINGVMVLKEILESEGLKLPKRMTINQSGLRRFFDSIQSRKGGKMSTTPIQFYKGFKKLYGRHLINSNVRKSEDSQKMYSKLADLPTNQPTSEVKNIINLDLDYQKNKKLMKVFTSNICDYLIEKCNLKHNCDTCRDYTRKYKASYNVMLPCLKRVFNHSHFKLLEDTGFGNDNFIYFVASMDVIFQQNFENLCFKNNIIHEFTTLFNKLNYQHPCPNFPYYYIFEMYARVRLFYTLKRINKNYRVINNKDAPIVWKVRKIRKRKARSEAEKRKAKKRKDNCNTM